MRSNRCVPLVICSLVFLCLVGVEIGGAQAEEPFLGAFIHVHSLFNHKADVEVKEASIAAAMDDCKRSGLQSVVPFVLTSSGAALYPSDVVPERKYGDWDPVEVIVREARKRDLSVYIAVPMLICGHKEPRGILEKHPEWALIGEEGNRLGYISGGNSEAQDWLLQVIEEVVGKYQPDGLLLDYLRFPNQPVDFDPDTRKRFIEETDHEDYEITNPDDPVFQSFKERSLVELAGRIRKKVDELKPGTEIGVYTWGPHVVHNHFVSQDWPTMARKGSIDLVNISGYIYREKYGDDYMQQFENNLKECLAHLQPDPPEVRLAFVLGVITSHGKIEKAEEIEKYLQVAQSLGIPGVSVFTLAYLQPFIDDLLETGPFDEPRAPIP